MISKIRQLTLGLSSLGCLSAFLPQLSLCQEAQPPSTPAVAQPSTASRQESLFARYLLDRIVVLDDIEYMISHGKRIVAVEPGRHQEILLYDLPKGNVFPGSLATLNHYSDWCNGLMPKYQADCLELSHQRFVLLYAADKERQVKRLKGVASLPFYGCLRYSMVNDSEPTYKCRYVRHFDLRDAPELRKRIPVFWNGLRVPDDASEAVETEREPKEMESIWLEFTSQFDSQGLPVLDPQDLVEPVIRPVALESGAELYLVEENEFGKSYPLASGLRSQVSPIFVIKQCKTAMAACANQVIEEYLAETEKLFGQAPISASPSTRLQHAPHELWLTREYKKSAVLGAPYYEFSQYNILCWYDQQSVYARLMQMVTVSANLNGNYTGPEPKQEVVYDDLIGRTSSNILASVCKTVGGRMDGQACVLE